MSNLALEDTQIFQVHKQISQNNEYLALKKLGLDEKETLIGAAMQSVYQCLFEIEISHKHT